MSTTDPSMMRLSARNRMTVARTTHPELHQAEVDARIDLGAAMLLLEEADELVDAGKREHSLDEQLEVQDATRRHSAALRRLLLGVENSQS